MRAERRQIEADLARAAELRSRDVVAEQAAEREAKEALVQPQTVVIVFQETSELDLESEYEFEAVGPSKRLHETLDAIIFAFFMALLAIYMILAAQFNSFLHPARAGRRPVAYTLIDDAQTAVARALNTLRSRSPAPR
jgi:multidrug efflux pump subunit AcrB